MMASPEGDRKRDLRRLRTFRDAAKNADALYADFRSFCLNAYGNAAVEEAEKNPERKRAAGRPAGAQAMTDITDIIERVLGEKFTSPDVENALKEKGTVYHAGTISKTLTYLVEGGRLRRNVGT